MSRWYVYVLKCGDSTLYTGVAVDVARRLREHRAGTGAKYTRGRAPLKVVYEQRFGTRGAALKREASIKQLSRKEKLALIKQRRRSLG